VAQTIFLSLILVLGGLVSVSAHATVYKYVDEQGHVHYSSQKPSNKKYKAVQIKSKKKSGTTRRSTKLKILPTKDLEKAVREGKISQTVADRMQYFNNVEEEYKLAQKKKSALKRALSKAKSNNSNVSGKELIQLEKEYDVFVKEDYYYARLNYTTATRKLLNLLDTTSNKTTRRSKKKNNKKEASINWNK